MWLAQIMDGLEDIKRKYLSLIYQVGRDPWV